MAVQFHVVGDALMDVLATDMSGIPTWGGEATASAIYSQEGGSALNTAIHLASIVSPPCTVHFHGCVGDDSFGATLRARLEKAGVDPHLRVLAGVPTGSCIVLSGSTDRSFITCAGASGQLAAEHLGDITAALPLARGPVHVHFGGFYAYGPLRHEAPALVRAWRVAGRDCGLSFSASVDVNGSYAAHVEGLPALLPLLDLFKGNSAEAAAAAGCGEAEALAALASESRCTVVTRGSGGAVFDGPARTVGADRVGGEVPSTPVDIRDTTGAGDAFSAALIGAWVVNRDLEGATVRGCAAGSLNCTRIGASLVPVTQGEIDALLGQ